MITWEVVCGVRNVGVSGRAGWGFGGKGRRLDVLASGTVHGRPSEQGVVLLASAKPGIGMSAPEPALALARSSVDQARYSPVGRIPPAEIPPAPLPAPRPVLSKKYPSFPNPASLLPLLPESVEIPTSMWSGREMSGSRLG